MTLIFPRHCLGAWRNFFGIIPATQYIDMKAALLLLSTCFLSLLVVAQTSQDKEAVKNVVIAFQEDFNDGTFKNAYTYTTEDWEHINPLGGVDKGRETVLNVVRSVHETFLKGVTMSVQTMSIRFINPNTAIATVVHRISDFTTPDGVTHKNEQHVKTYVVARNKGKWLLTHDHASIVQAGPSTGSPK
jgi:uncharacterized protein (TIGR02246 family)